MDDCNVYEEDGGIVIHCPPVGMTLTKDQARKIMVMLKDVLTEYKCPKCNSKNLHTAYCDDEAESLSCEECNYSADIKEFVRKDG